MAETPNRADTPWWDRNRHRDRRGFLLARNRVKAAVRGWLEGEGFTEVECGQLQASPGNEVHLHGYATERIEADGTRHRLYLHTSPEFAAKKLLAAGETAIFDFARVFRNREAPSPLHAHEFTMLEWYRAGASWPSVAEDALALARAGAAAVGAGGWAWRERQVAADTPAIWLSMADAFARYAGIDLAATMLADGTGDQAAMADAVRAAGLKANESDSWSDLFTEVLVARIDPALAGMAAPVILHDWPRPEAALARACPGDPRFAERFELYLCGVELANGFGELTDAVEQRARFEAAMATQQALFGESLPLDEDLLAALAEMPEASGVALGFERLVMLATGARDISDVMWTM
jgi:elongation factor P--(R)-beta-lysine ligase